MATTQGKGVYINVRGMSVVGLILLGFAGWYGHRQYAIVQSWLPVEAVVTKSQVTQHGSFQRSRGGSQKMYTTEVEFRYTLDGKELVATTTPGYDSSSRSGMEDLAKTYGPGTRHTIRYNPAHPNDISMSAGYNFGFFAPALIAGGLGVLLLGIGVSQLLPSRSIKALQCPACGNPVDPSQRFCRNCGAPLQLKAA